MKLRFLMMPEGEGGGGAGGGNPPPAGGAGGTPPPANWYSSITDAEDRGFIENKKYPDLAHMVKAHRSLESHLGAPKERLITLPEKADDPKWNEIYGKLGR